MGSGWPNNDLVFTHADGTGLWPQTITAHFRTIAGNLGLPTIGVHGLRHSAATFLIASGINPRVVQQRLGHAHVSVTLGLYTHVLPAHDRAAADTLAAAIDAVQ
jgi:integrase